MFFTRYGFQNLLVALLLYLMAGSFLSPFRFAHIVIDVLLTLVLVLAVFVIHKKITLSVCTVPLLVVLIGVMWVEKIGYLPYSDKLMSWLLGVFLFFLVSSFFRFIFSVKRVDVNLICAALCLYLILGLLWGTIYGLLQIYVPGSFAGDLLSPDSTATDTLHYFTYFSFVTLTTLGYGDILPQTPIATALCQVEAILGQFFTAVLVARLVGIQVAQQFMEDTS